MSNRDKVIAKLNSLIGMKKYRNTKFNNEHLVKIFTENEGGIYDRLVNALAMYNHNKFVDEIHSLQIACSNFRYFADKNEHKSFEDCLYDIYENQRIHKEMIKR